jgi:hypothetical protein
MEIKGKEKPLPSGAVLYVVPAKFIESYDFMGALLGCMENRLSPAALDSDEYREVFSNLVASKFFTDAKLRESTWKCLEYCLYKASGSQVTEKVSTDLFDRTGKREDVSAILYEVAHENLYPFFEGLWKASKTLQEILKSIPRQSESPNPKPH